MTVASAIPATPAAPASGAATSGSDALRALLRIGAIGSVVALYLCLVGVVPEFNERPLIADVVSLGQMFLLLTYLGIGYLAARPHAAGAKVALLGWGAAGGALTGILPAVLVLAMATIDVRSVFLRASPALLDELTRGAGVSGFYWPIVIGAITGAVAGLILALPSALRSALVWSFGMTVFFGLFGGLLRTPMLNTPAADLARTLFASDGLTVVGAIVVFVGTFLVNLAVRVGRVRHRIAAMPETQRKAASIPLGLVVLGIVLIFPHLFGPFFAQVIAIVALYVLLGLGMNITLGLAGLLDLGFVAFYAVGAFTVGLLTSTGPLGIAGWTFWQALPFAVIFAMLFGILLGLPILRIRGDYLAIATLGFGEIIRILAGSDLAKGVLGGPQGITNIPKPIDVPPTHWLAGPIQIYYLALFFAVIVAFVAWRLRGSRIGRSWMAIREDEDVAEGVGINLVSTKLLAYMLGGGFAGLAGAINAGLVGAIFPSSIQLFLSINVVAIVIIGGMGSIPGVVAGAVFLIGLPELFREFSDYRFLFYGIALIAMMVLRPEGILPSKVTRRELHSAEEVVAIEEAEALAEAEDAAEIVAEFDDGEEAPA